MSWRFLFAWLFGCARPLRLACVPRLTFLYRLSLWFLLFELHRSLLHRLGFGISPPDTLPDLLLPLADCRVLVFSFFFFLALLFFSSLPEMQRMGGGGGVATAQEWCFLKASALGKGIRTLVPFKGWK